MSQKTGIRTLLAALAACLFAGCLIDEPTGSRKKIYPPQQSETETECPGSPLCRVDNMQDTISLTPKQKEELVKVIETTDDSVVVAITTIDIESLLDTSTRIEALKEIQMDLFKEMSVPVDLSQLSHVSFDSILASVKTQVNGDVTNLTWSGTIGNVNITNVSLNIKGDEFLDGTVVVDDKVFSFKPLGGDKIAIVYDSKMIWMGECPSMPKATRVQLTCDAQLLP